MKALVLCGGLSQLRLIENLKNRSIYVVLADMNPSAPAVKYADAFFSVSTLDVEGIRDLAIQERVDFILSVCADQMLLVAAQVSEELGLPCYIDYETAVLVSNKEDMKRIFVENEIPTSEYIVNKEIVPADVENLTWPLIVKPVDCYSSKGVKKVKNEKELLTAFKRGTRLSRTGTAIVEEYVGGDEYSVDIYVEEGEAKLLCIRVLDKIPEGNGFIICRGRYSPDLPEKLQSDIKAIGQKIANAFELKNTPMLIQFKIDGDRVSVIEFCARTGGGIKYRLLPYVSNFDAVDAIVELTLGNKPHYEEYRLKKYIVDEFIYCKKGVLDHVEGFDEILNEGIITHWEQFKPSGHEFSEIKSSGDRFAYFSVEADTPEELETKFIAAGNRIRAISTNGEDLIKHDIIEFKREWFQ